nr:MAG TPA: hypothetical protein [Caudoviricetes sp.]
MYSDDSKKEPIVGSFLNSRQIVDKPPYFTHFYRIIQSPQSAETP